MDPTATSAARYSRGAMAFHWIIAILIMTNFGLAWAGEDLHGPEKYQYLGNHKAIGIVVLLLSVGRIVWRLTHAAPPMVETLKAWEAALARVVHVLFYFLIVAVPVAGWALSSSFMKGGPVSVFGLFNFPGLPVAGDKPTQAMFHELHETFATLMLVLLGLHILAALKHQFFDRDDTLRRMLPFLK